MLTSSEARITLPDGVDLHARPAGVFVRTAMRFGSRISVTHGDKSADAKSILAVLALGATAGSTLVVQADGADAGAALEALGACLRDVH